MSYSGTWTQTLQNAEADYGPNMASADTSAALLQALQGLQAKTVLDGASHDAIQDAGRALITRVGNQSNLILDPDLGW